ncbi:hypothetical protein BwSF12_33020 [Bradyrhizobium ottawaense]|nr:hypothetical protein TM102_26210 [Bradyrhizobium sp. TM102]GMO33633.1 hypothetical protein BwSF12_33020 [Bradyrhizobium ottawaense]GMO95364.1 hypothetical protein BwSF19_75540 [Bradyrhizobium ottawaense]
MLRGDVPAKVARGHRQPAGPRELGLQTIKAASGAKPNHPDRAAMSVVIGRADGGAGVLRRPLVTQSLLEAPDVY